MAGAGAGAGLPILVLFILNALVLGSWVIWGQGNKNTKFILLAAAIVIFTILINLSGNLESFPIFRDTVQVITIVFPIFTLFIPSIYKRVLNEQNT